MATVLIAEDSNLTRSMLKNIISDAGHTIVAELSDGSSVLTALQKYEPEVVLLDIILPGSIGLDILKEAKAKYPHIKVIVVSQLTHPSIIDEAINSGADTFISKPINKEVKMKILNAI